MIRQLFKSKKMRIFSITILLLIGITAVGQQSKDPMFEKMLVRLVTFNVPTIEVNQLKKWQKEGQTIYVLDARESEEYNVSHLKGAKYIGYNKFSKDQVEAIPKDAKVVVYCSVGYRSGKVVKKLRKWGFTKAYNLHGSIFEWVNEGNTVVNNEGKVTPKVHTYNKKWSKWLKKGEKVY